MSVSFERTKTNEVVRVPKRGIYDKETVYTIIDEALICHVGLVQDGQPFVIPTLHARYDNNLLLHGATTSRLIQYAQSGQKICVTMTLVDGLVMARSVFHHSANYRSAALFGQGQLVPDEEKMSYLEYFTNRLMPGRWEDARRPNEQEFKATSVVSIPIDLASAKIRVGPPSDDDEDYALPVWAGVLPIRQQFLKPEADPKLSEGISIPDYINDFIKEKEAEYLDQ